MSGTKRKMAMALKELLAEKPLKKITVQDIVERSHMTRQSFYYHFQDIYEVLELIYQYQIVDHIAYREEQSFSEWLSHLVKLVDENRVFYRKVLQELDWGRLSAKLRPPVEKQVNRLLERHLPERRQMRGLEGGLELLRDFLATSIIMYLFNYASAKKVSEIQKMENLEQLMKVCALLQLSDK